MRLFPRKKFEEADRALADARRNVSKVKARDGEVQEVASALRNLREKNHFAEQLQALMVRPPKGV